MPKGGTVWVDAKVDGERLVLVVGDDGAGQRGGAVSRGGPGMGTGLSNVRERLAGLYGDRQTMKTTTGDGRGTEVRVEMPAIMEGSAGG